jgi:hypothetical protein
MNILMVALHANGPGPPDDGRLARAVAARLPERYPDVVGHVMSMTAAARLVELAVVLREGVPDPRARLRGCVEEVLAELADGAVPDAVRWTCHAPRLPDDPADVW